MMTAVPLVVPLWLASRHLLPYTTSCLRAVYTHVWFTPPLQSHSWACVPLMMVLLFTSTHRPDCVPISAKPLAPGSGLIAIASMSGAQVEAFANVIVLLFPARSDTMTEIVPGVVHD